MKLATAKFARVKNGLPHFAIVSLNIDPHAAAPRIELSCTGAGFTSQGYAEEVPAIGYDDWKAGAKAGVSYALAVAEREACSVEITKIEGMGTDTNPTIVGAAAAIATWQALEFDPPTAIREKLEAQALSSWNLSHDAIPKFA